MHYHSEIIMPPTDDIEGAIASIMAQFNENGDEDDEDFYAGTAFWDFYVIGGRFAGQKQMARYDQAKLDEFEKWLQNEKVTVSGVRAGKQELSPASQIAKVDAKWNEMFPSTPPQPCPLFKHSNDQYGKGLGSTLPDDVMRLVDTPKDLNFSHVIFAGPGYTSETDGWDGATVAKFMLTDTAWNGCNHMPVKWDCTLGGALEAYAEYMKNFTEEFREKFEPKDDWLVVTVDYHR